MKELQIPDEALELIIEVDAVQDGVSLAVGTELLRLAEELKAEENANVIWRAFYRRGKELVGELDA